MKSTSCESYKHQLLCVYCGDEMQVEMGRYHHNEEDTYYCTCEHAHKEIELQKKLAPYENEIRKIKLELESMKSDCRDTLNQAKYMVGKRKLRIELGLPTI